MRPLTVHAISQAVNAAEPGSTLVSCSAVSTDTRTVQPGDCFVALSGPTFDGHAFVDQAFAKGASCCVVHRPVLARCGPGQALVRVQDTTLALGDLARAVRRQATFQVVAITGSVGKTTTRHILAHVLQRRFRTHHSPKNFNNAIGLPLTLLGAPAEAQVVIAELGTNRPGEIGYLTRIALPDVAVVTNVHPAHLEGFGSVEAIGQEKLSIAEGLIQGGPFIANADQPWVIEACRAKGLRPLTFGLSDQAQIQARDTRYLGTETSFLLDGTFVRIPLAGPGNVLNALAAWAVCRHLGISIQEFSQAVGSLRPATMRSEVLRIGPVTVINDCYNANPASMQNAVEILKSLEPAPGSRRVFVCGLMAELGEQSEALHRDLGVLIGRAGIDSLIAVGPMAGLTAQAAADHSQGRTRTACYEDADRACQNLQDHVQQGDVVLVKGSRCARLEVVTEQIRRIYSCPPDQVSPSGD